MLAIESLKKPHTQTHTNTPSLRHYALRSECLNSNTLRTSYAFSYIAGFSFAHSSLKSGWKGIAHHHHQYMESSKTNRNMIKLTLYKISIYIRFYLTGISKHHIDYINTKLDVSDFNSSKVNTYTGTSLNDDNLNYTCANYLLHLNFFPVCLEYFAFRNWKRKFEYHREF